MISGLGLEGSVFDLGRNAVLIRSGRGSVEDAELVSDSISAACTASVPLPSEWYRGLLSVE